MSTTRSYIGLGGNIGSLVKTLRAAVDAIDTLPTTDVLACSSLYRTPAWGVTTQPDFLNAVVMIDTDLAPLELLSALMQIERQHGRQRETEQRWGPRTLDLDILLYADARLELPELHLPHPRLHQRAFALVPLLDISPDIMIPGIGPASDALLAMLPLDHPPVLIPAPAWNASP